MNPLAAEFCEGNRGARQGIAGQQLSPIESQRLCILGSADGLPRDDHIAGSGDEVTDKLRVFEPPDEQFGCSLQLYRGRWVRPAGQDVGKGR